MLIFNLAIGTFPRLVRILWYGKTLSIDLLSRRIYLLRGQKVMLSTDLAELYGVEPRVLIQAVKRNRERFPGDFILHLTMGEAKILRSQFVILRWGQHIKHPPYAFTEQGVAMLSSVLRSKRAIQVNIAIMRAFVRLRETLALHKELAAKLELLERKVKGQNAKIRSVFAAIRELMTVPEKPRLQIGFKPPG